MKKKQTERDLEESALTALLKLGNHDKKLDVQKTKVNTKPHAIEHSGDLEHPSGHNLRPRRQLHVKLETDALARKRPSQSQRISKVAKRSDEDIHTQLQNLQKAVKDLTEKQAVIARLESELKTHTEAIQGLMQVVSTPQNLANFQQQYAYQQLASQQHASPSTQQQVQYMPVFAYHQPMYYHHPAPIGGNVKKEGSAPVEDAKPSTDEPSESKPE